MTPITRALFRQRLLRTGHRLKSLELSSALRLALLVGLGGLVLVDGLGRLWVERPLAIVDAAVRRADLLASSMRLSVLLAAVVSFDSFGDLWRSRDQEILGGLPIPPTSLYVYRLASVTLRGLPFLGVVFLVWGRVLLAGEGAVFLDGCALIALGFLGAAVWGLYWHLVAGAGVANPEVNALQEVAAGSATSPERAMLLYSPMFALASAFAIAFVGLIALDAYRDGSGAALAVVLGCVGAVGFGVYRGRQRFEADYYLALAALADGEALEGAFTEAAPGPEYFGGWYAERVPRAVRPFVRRDLRQAWRRNRLAPWALVGLSGALVLLGSRMGGWVPVAGGVLLLAGAAESFRLAREGSDAPWFWLTLPSGLGTLYGGRLLSALFYGLIVSPGVAIALWRWGAGGMSLLLPLGLGLGLGVLAVNLSTLTLGQGRWAQWIHWVIGGAAVALCAPELFGAEPLLWPTALGGAALGAMSLGILPGLNRRLAELEMAR